MNTKTVRLLALVASVAFAACGDTTDLILDELNEAEAQDLAGAVLFATFSSAGDVPSQPSSSVNGPQAAPYEFSSSFEGDVACPMGGLVGVAASLDVSGDNETGAGRVEYTMTQVHDACMASSESGVVFTLFGAPSMSLDFVVEDNGEGVIDWGGSVMGGLEWVTDGRTGTCEVDLSFEGRQTPEAASVSGALAGSICGFQVQRSFSIGMAAG